jgi:pyridoxal phosphate enzyme (YggS family)
VPIPEHPYYTLCKACESYHATLVAVSKTRNLAEIDALYKMGQRVFAENRVQELVEKTPFMGPDIVWHLIGHLQTNKVKTVLPLVSCIQSLDRITLWEKLNEEAGRISKKISCLLQIKISDEDTKYGWSFEELNLLLQSSQHRKYPNIILEGVMGMASLTPDQIQVRVEMRQLKSYFDLLKTNYFNADREFKTISMGMSGDYQIALEEGSTMIRVGSLLFPKDN